MGFVVRLHGEYQGLSTRARGPRRASVESGATCGAFGASGGATGRGGAGNQTGDGAAGAQIAGGTGGGAGTPGSGGATGTGGVAGASGGTTSSGTGGAGGNAGVAGGAAGAGGAAWSCTGTLFCTDFDTRDVTAWASSGGSWSVILDPDNKQGWVYSGGNGSFVSTVQTTWADQAVEVRMYLAQVGGTGGTYRAGLIARYQSSSAYYSLAVDADGYLRLLRGTSTLSGTGCAMVSSGHPLRSWMTLKLQVSGSTNVRLVSWLDGVQIHDCTNASGVQSGTAGVVTYGTGTVADFDQFRVTSQ